MKRFLYILSAITLLMGCNDVGDIYIGNPEEIMFATKQVSRSALNQTDIDNGKASVYVCGVQNNTSKIFNNVAITRDAVTGKWFSSTKRNWVEGSNYSFHAYAYNTRNGLTIDSNKDGLEISVQQPTTYNEAAMIDYLLSYSFKVADGAIKPIVQLYLEHAMSLVEIYVVRGNMFEARLTKIVFENIYTQGTMKCTAQAVANSGDKNVWEISPSGTTNASYTFAPATPVVIGDKREGNQAHMSIMCLPQQLTANARLIVEYEVNEKVTPDSPDNYTLHREEFQLYNYQPLIYKPGHRIVYTATVDSGVNLEGTIAAWRDVDYIEGTVLPEIK